MKISTIIAQAVLEGTLTPDEASEWEQLTDQLKRLDRLSYALSTGDVDPTNPGELSQKDVADILGVSQQLVSRSERSGLAKIRKAFKAKGLDRHINGNNSQK